MNKTS